MPKIVGKTILKGPTSYSYSPVTGITFRPSWNGTHSALKAAGSELVNQGIAHDFESDGTVARLTLEQINPEEGEETPVTNWALQGSEETVEFRYHPLFLSFACKEQLILTAALNGEMREAEFAPFDNDGIAQDVDWADSKYGVVSLNAKTSPWYMYCLIWNGQTHFQRSSYKLRCVQMVSEKYEAELFANGVNAIYTQAQLLSECALFSKPLPQMYITQIITVQDDLRIQMGGTAVISEIESDQFYTYGWLKGTPSYGQLVNGRIESSCEWTLQLWPNILYPNKT